MAYISKTVIFSCQNLTEGSESEWVSASGICDQLQNTYGYVTPSNGEWYNGYIRVDWNGAVSGITDDITKVEVGIRGKAENTYDNLLVILPRLRNSLYKKLNLMEYTPTTSIENTWLDITDYINKGNIISSWSRNELDKLYVEVYPINQYVFWENTFRVYEVYLKVTYNTTVTGTVSESTTSDFQMTNPVPTDLVNNVFQITTSGSFSMSSSSTPAGDDWYGYKNDGFFNNKIEDFWTQSFTTSGTATEGKYNLRIYSGEGKRDSGSGLYQTLASGTEIDVVMKVSNTNASNNMRSDGVGLLLKVDNNNFMSITAKKNVVGFSYKYSRTKPGVGGSINGAGGNFDSQYRKLPYYFRITCTMSGGAPLSFSDVTYNYMTAYFSNDGEDWELFGGNWINYGPKNIWVIANHNEDTQFWADVDYFGGITRHIPDRYSYSTLGYFTMEDTTTSG